MNILVLGSGGREHAICHALLASRRVKRLLVLPGNAGTGLPFRDDDCDVLNIPGDASDVAFALQVARRERVALTIVGPEDPLAAGVVDAFEEAGHRIFGPRAAAARLESDKTFAKAMMRQQAIPTAEARIFDDYALAEQYIASRDEPLVVKAAGLARGKGVILCDEPSQAILAAEQMLKKRSFGDAGARIVVEERLAGREVSLLAIVAGQTAYLLEPAQDYKRLRDGDAGPNTGGMGAYCPSTTLDEATIRNVQENVLVPTLEALHREGVHYCGVLYMGLMLTASGPKVLEFNCRFGDPETQVILPRMRTPLLDVIEAAVDHRLDQISIDWDPRSAVCVVMAAEGYPNKSRAGDRIEGLDHSFPPEVIVFHAGTRQVGDDVVTAGGRVLGVTALGATLDEARRAAYAAAGQIRFSGAQFRTDIAAQASP